MGFMLSCSNAPEGKKVEAESAKETAKTSQSATVYTVNTASSAINWVGSKPTGQHSGTLNLSSGNLAVVDGNITAGEFVLDMNSIANADMAGQEGQQKLEGHLKTGDFFEVENYPTGNLKLLKCRLQWA